MAQLTPVVTLAGSVLWQEKRPHPLHFDPHLVQVVGASLQMPDYNLLTVRKKKSKIGSILKRRYVVGLHNQAKVCQLY